MPSSVVTVMVAVPSATAVTLPFSFTVATLVSLLSHVTFWLVALPGVMVAVRVPPFPGFRDRVLGDSDTPVTL